MNKDICICKSFFFVMQRSYSHLFTFNCNRASWDRGISILMKIFILLEKAGGLDKLTLDSLYDDAIRRSNQPTNYNPWEPASVASSAMLPPTHDPFYASNGVAAPLSIQMATMTNQQQNYMWQQQQPPQMMMMGQQQTANPFGNAYGGAGMHPYGMPAVPAYNNPYPGLIWGTEHISFNKEKNMKIHFFFFFWIDVYHINCVVQQKVGWIY